MFLFVGSMKTGFNFFIERFLFIFGARGIFYVIELSNLCHQQYLWCRMLSSMSITSISNNKPMLCSRSIKYKKNTKLFPKRMISTRSHHISPLVLSHRHIQRPCSTVYGNLIRNYTKKGHGERLEHASMFVARTSLCIRWYAQHYKAIKRFMKTRTLVATKPCGNINRRQFVRNCFESVWIVFFFFNEENLHTYFLGS